MRPDHGSVLAEHAALRSGSGFVWGAVDLVWVRGPDAVSFVDGLVSQDVAAMGTGAVARSFLLEPRGKLVALLWVLRGDESVGLVSDAGTGEAVAGHLDRFRFRVAAAVEEDDRTGAVVVGGDGAATRARFDPGSGAWSDRSGVLSALLRGRAIDRVAVFGPSPEELLDLGLRRCGAVAWDTVRIEAGEPVMDRDVDGGTIPQETGLVGEAVSFTKGCYVGQELVARIDSRGHVNRRLMGIRLETNVVPPVGAAVVAGESEAGHLTTVGESPIVVAPVALAVVRREVAAGSEVTIRWDGGDAPARALDLPLVADPHGGFTVS